MGGNAAGGTGIWTKSGNNNSFIGIYIKAGTLAATNIQGNTISNFDYTNSGTGFFYGLQLSGGTLNIGTIMANIVGSAAVADAIKYTSTNGAFNGVLIDALTGTGVIRVENNTVGNITFPSSTTTYTSINGIFKNSTSTSTTVTIQNNTINNITSLYTGTTGFKVYGIQAAGGSINGSYGIIGNLISNISSSCKNTTTNTGYVAGIYSSVHAIIKNNTVSGITSQSKNTSTTETTAIGIIARANKDYIITGNTINNIKNDNSTLAATAVAVTGIYCTTTATTSNVISGNFISDLSVNASSTAASIYGIKVDQLLTGAYVNVHNNIVSIGGTTQSNLYGIYQTVGAAYATKPTIKIYFNTVSISGTAPVNASSYALYSDSYSIANPTFASVRDFENNIFSNTRNNQSAGTAPIGNHATYFTAGTDTDLTLDYNNYYASGTGGVLGYYNAANVTSLPLITSKDANSVNIDPQFENTGGTAAANYMVKATLTGVDGTGITSDYLGATRGTSPTMGAWETYIKWTGATDSNWSTATNWSSGTVPLATSTINIPCGSNVVLDQDFTVQGALTVNGCATLTISPTKTLTIQGVADFGNQSVIFKSDATGTARLGTLTGTLSNATNVTVERYIPARRAFRFLSSAVTTTTSIKVNWQENGGSASGLGTHITGSVTGTNGFDATATGNPSMFTHDNTAGTWASVSNTDVNTLTAGVSYRLMVRGDRTVSLATNTPTPTSTSLRATGTLFTGPKAVSDLNGTADAFSMIGNPYQSPVDMQAILAAATNLKAFYYIWDPTLGTRGAYVTRDLTSGTNSSDYSLVDNYLQPGQACFVQTTATGATALNFTEASKYTAVTNQNVFRLANAKTSSSSIRLNLYDSTVLANQGPTVDGLVVIFSDNNSNAVDENDAGKLTNLDENLATNTDGKLLSIENRALPVATDEIQLYSDQYRSTEYTLVAEGVNMTGETPYLLDQFNGIYTEIPQTGKINYKYSVDPTNTASTASNRLKIVFANKSLGINTQELTSELKLYPNPSNGGKFTILLPDATIETKISISNSLGQVIYGKTIAATGPYNVNLNQSVSAGIYFVSIEQGGKIEVKKLIIK